MSSVLVDNSDWLQKVIKNGLELKGAEAFTGDREVVHSAVLENGDALQFANKKLQGDEQIVRSALKQYGGALKHVSTQIQDKELIRFIADIIPDDDHCIDVLFEWIENEDNKDTERPQFLYKIAKENNEILDLKNKDGKRAVDIAYPECKKKLESARYLFGEYDVSKDRPLHLSKTACVLQGQTGNNDAFHKDRVAVKCMTSLDHVMAELEGRKDIDSNYVLNIKYVYVDSDLCTNEEYEKLEEAAKNCNTALKKIDDLKSEVSSLVQNRRRVEFDKHEETGGEELLNYNFVLIFDLAERTLEKAQKHERISHSKITVKKVLIDLIHAIDHLHENGCSHSDLKPLNIVNLGLHWRLIDLDVSCTLGKSFGSKLPSSGYCPPEVAELCFNKQMESYKGCKSYDFWSLGVIAFHLETNEPLWQMDGDDNIVEHQQKELLNWDVTKCDDRFDKVKDPYMRDLLKKLLHQDPKERLEFFKGKMSKVLEDKLFEDYTDSTGLLNKQTFEIEKKEFDLKAKTKLCAFFAVDAANFKSVNDTFSHSVGDQALVDIALNIKERCEGIPDCNLYHSGGDEYQVLIECKEDEEKFKEMVEKTAKGLSTIEYRKTEEEKRVMCFLRIGVVCFRGATYNDADELEHEVKRRIMESRNLNAESRDPVTDSKPDERFLIVFEKDQLGEMNGEK